jgi:CBS-domain-containing membrane protein
MWTSDNWYRRECTVILLQGDERSLRTDAQSLECQAITCKSVVSVSAGTLTPEQTSIVFMASQASMHAVVTVAIRLYAVTLSRLSLSVMRVKAASFLSQRVRACSDHSVKHV